MMIIYMISPVFIASLPAQTDLLDCQTFHTFGRTWKQDNRPTAIAGDDVTNLWELSVPFVTSHDADFHNFTKEACWWMTRMDSSHLLGVYQQAEHKFWKFQNIITNIT